MGETSEVQQGRRCRFDAMALAILIGTSGVVCLLAVAAYWLMQAVIALVYPLLSMLMAVQQ